MNPSPRPPPPPSLLRPLFEKPFPVCIHINKPLTKDPPSLKTSSAGVLLQVVLNEKRGYTALKRASEEGGLPHKGSPTFSCFRSGQPQHHTKCQHVSIK